MHRKTKPEPSSAQERAKLVEIFLGARNSAVNSYKGLERPWATIRVINQETPLPLSFYGHCLLMQVKTGQWS